MEESGKEWVGRSGIYFKEWERVGKSEKKWQGVEAIDLPTKRIGP